jgi:hypothetical protein
VNSINMSLLLKTDREDMVVVTRILWWVQDSRMAFKCNEFFRPPRGLFALRSLAVTVNFSADFGRFHPVQVPISKDTHDTIVVDVCAAARFTSLVQPAVQLALFSQPSVALVRGG